MYFKGFNSFLISSESVVFIFFNKSINSSKNINKSLSRTGRFDETIEFKEPESKIEQQAIMEYHYKKGNNFKHKIVSFKNSYHGSTFLNYNLGDSLFENPFYSLLPYEHTIRLDKNFDLGDTDCTQVAAIIIETRSWSNWLKKEPIDF